MQNFRALGAQTPVPPAAGALPSDPQTAPPHCEFLATRMGEDPKKVFVAKFKALP